MFIDKQIAQKIVDRSMKIVGMNINVMNHQGVIIGSGDRNRVGQLHEGALHVLKSHSEVDISSGQESQLHGVKEGVNLPILFEGETVGVVGITGDPTQVRKYADLVVMTAELVVEQAALTARVQWDQRARERIITRLIEGGRRDSLFDDRIKRLNIDLSNPLVAVVIHVEPSGRAGYSLNLMQHLVAVLTSAVPEDLIAVTSPNQLVTLKQIKLIEDEWDTEDTRLQLESLCNLLDRQNTGTFRVSVGGYFDGEQGVSTSYRHALKMLEIAQSKNPSQQLILPDALDLMLYEAKDCWGAQHLKRQLEKLATTDKGSSMFKTLETYVELNKDFGKTAEHLHIHRNTLRYRLDKINNLLGLDLNKTDHFLRIAIAMRIHELH